MRSLHAMIRPENLRPIIDFDRIIGLSAGVHRRKRLVVARVPILREDDVGEPGGQPVDKRNDLIGARHLQRAARAEVILNIDDEQNFVFVHGSKAELRNAAVFRRRAAARRIGRSGGGCRWRRG